MSNTYDEYVGLLQIKNARCERYRLLHLFTVSNHIQSLSIYILFIFLYVKRKGAENTRRKLTA